MKKSKKIKAKKRRIKHEIKNNQILDFLYQNRGHIIALLIILLIALLVHGINMFNYPYYENDEGTYLSRGWALINQGRLDPYTFWYDHVPFASFIIGFWLLLTGGVDTFGMSVNSGRVLMLVLHLADVVLIYYIGWRMTGRKFMGVFAAILLTISPLSIYFYRRLLLDNIIAFLMLATIAILVKEKLTFRWILVSAVFFALGVLTKENVAIFLPIYLAIVWFRTKGTTRYLSSFNWLIVAGGLISLYFLYALLKQEFFFPGQLGTPEDSVSLLNTLKFHLGRGSDFPFWHSQSDFMSNFTEWFRRDKVLIVIGIISLVALIPIGIKNKWARVLFAFSIVNWWFLMRGGLILNFYIVPVIPFIALNVGFVLDWLFDKLQNTIKIPASYFYLISFVFIFAYFIYIPKDAFILDENVAFRKAVAWANENLEGDEFLVVDNAIYLDLQDGDMKFRNAEWFWKVDKDPDLYVDILEEDWKNIDYIFLSHETVKQMKSGHFPYIQNALTNSIELERWDENASAHVDVEQLISTNGDWGRIYRVPSDAELKEAKTWEFIRDNYIYSYGQMYNSTSGETTSYMQSSGMYMAVLADDQASFDGLRAWTNDHFAHRVEDKLLSSIWKQKNLESDGEVTETGTSTRADIQYVASLLMAYEKWGDDKYKEEALGILPDLWETEIIEIRGRFYVTSGSAAAIYNPSINGVDSFYIDPYAGLPEYMELFTKYDEYHNWKFVKEDWYLHTSNILAQRKKGQETRLLPNLMILSLDGKLRPINEYDPSSLVSSIATISLVKSFEEELSVNHFASINPYRFDESDKNISLSSSQRNAHLISDHLSLLEAGVGQKTPLYDYLYERGFDYDTGEWKDVEDISSLYLLWSISDNGKELL